MFINEPDKKVSEELTGIDIRVERERILEEVRCKADVNPAGLA